MESCFSVSVLRVDITPRPIRLVLGKLKLVFFLIVLGTEHVFDKNYLLILFYEMNEHGLLSRSPLQFHALID